MRMVCEVQGCFIIVGNRHDKISVVLGEPVAMDIITLNDAENYSVMILLFVYCMHVMSTHTGTNT